MSVVEFDVNVGGSEVCEEVHDGVHDVFVSELFRLCDDVVNGVENEACVRWVNRFEDDVDSCGNAVILCPWQ